MEKALYHPVGTQTIQVLLSPVCVSRSKAGSGAQTADHLGENADLNLNVIALPPTRRRASGPTRKPVVRVLFVL